MAYINFDSKIEKIWSGISYGILTVLFLIHFTFYYFVHVSQLNNIFDNLYFSPVFNFKLSSNTCEEDEFIIFHQWEEEDKFIGIMIWNNFKH